MGATSARNMRDGAFKPGAASAAIDLRDAVEVFLVTTTAATFFFASGREHRTPRHAYTQLKGKRPNKN